MKAGRRRLSVPSDFIEVSNGRDTTSRNRLTLPLWLERACAPRAVCSRSLVPSRSAQAADSGQPKNVLVLYSFSDRSLFDPLDNLKAAIRSRVNSPVNFYVHYLEAQGLEDPNYDHSLSENLRSELSGVKLDLVITAVYSSYQFALRHRDELFPGVPIVFSYVHASRVDGKQLPPGVTGVTVSVGFERPWNLLSSCIPVQRISRSSREAQNLKDFGGLQFAISSVHMQKR